ncbi:hypothetical protein ABEW32_09275 [Paenibacillus jamilae]|uniref:hypothetical protein n=1 Tax=Paenibacillus jamilae TaxID=114136 RepID=UPI003D2DDC50
MRRTIQSINYTGIHAQCEVRGDRAKLSPDGSSPHLKGWGKFFLAAVGSGGEGFESEEASAFAFDVGFRPL